MFNGHACTSLLINKFPFRLTLFIKFTLEVLKIMFSIISLNIFGTIHEERQDAPRLFFKYFRGIKVLVSLFNDVMNCRLISLF